MDVDGLSSATAEAARLQALNVYGVLDTPPEPPFDDLARLAARLCDTPVALVTLVDDHRQWFKAVVGLEVRETPRQIAFCAHTICGDGLFEVEDALQDPRFANNPLVTGDTAIRFYAGMPLPVEGGHRLGSLAVIDHQPRRLSAAQRDDLAMLARQVVLLLEERHQRLRAEAAMAEARRQSESLLAIAGRVARLGAWELDVLRQRVVWSDVVAEIHCMQAGFSPGLDDALSFYVEPDRTLLAQAVQRCMEHGNPFDMELVLQPAHGARRWVRAMGEAVRDDSGRITHLRGACQDITERMLQTLEIERLAQHQSAMLEGIPDPFVTVGFDYRIRLANTAFTRMARRARRQVMGEALSEALLALRLDASFLEGCRGAMSSRQLAEFVVDEVRYGQRFAVRAFPVDDGLAIHARAIA